jgi:hypothetical protein
MQLDMLSFPFAGPPLFVPTDRKHVDTIQKNHIRRKNLQKRSALQVTRFHWPTMRSALIGSGQWVLPGVHFQLLPSYLSKTD